MVSEGAWPQITLNQKTSYLKSLTKGCGLNTYRYVSCQSWHSVNLLRLSVTVGVVYGSPTDEVSRLITEALKEHKRILQFPEPVILFEDFGESSLVFTVYFWAEIGSQMDFRIVASDLRHILDKCLREAGITIAFPQRDVHIDHPRPIQVQLIDKQQLENPDDYKPGSG
jgi:small-conductance mechanosensitive channel